MQVIIREIYDSYFYPRMCRRADRVRPINFHEKTSDRVAREQQYTAARLRAKLFSTRRSVFLVVGGGGTKKTPFLIPAVPHSSASDKLYAVPIESQYRGNDSSTQFFSLPLSPPSFSYAMRIRDPSEGMNRRSFQFRLANARFFSRVDLFFSPPPPHLPINFLRFLPCPIQAPPVKPSEILGTENRQPLHIRTPNWRIWIFKSVGICSIFVSLQSLFDTWDSWWK